MSLIIRQRLYNTCILRVSQGQAIHQAVRRNLWIRLLERVTGWKFKFSAGERISRVSIKGRSGRKDKVSTPISILVSKRVFNRRHARTCVANDMRRAAARKNRWDMRGSCTREFFRAVHLLLFFIENALRDANLFIYLSLERNNLNLPSWL